MSVANFTLFEIHLHDGFRFSPANNVPPLSKGVDTLIDTNDESHDDYNAEFDAEFDADESDEFDEVDDAESGGHPGLRLLVRLILLVGIATVVRYIRGGDDDLGELVDLDNVNNEKRGGAEADI